jgi:hypothetical protein
LFFTGCLGRKKKPPAPNGVFSPRNRGDRTSPPAAGAVFLEVAISKGPVATEGSSLDLLNSRIFFPK